MTTPDGPRSGHVRWSDVKARRAATTLVDHTAGVAQMAADYLLAGYDLGDRWPVDLEQAETVEQVLAIRGAILSRVAEINRSEAEEYRSTGVKPARLERE